MGKANHENNENWIPTNKKYFTVFQWIVRLQISHTLPLFFVVSSQLKHWKHYVAQLFTYDVIMKNNCILVCDVGSLVCKIKVLNGRVWGT